MLIALGLSACTEGPLPRDGDIVLLPHHLIVKPIIEDMYEELSDETWPKIIIVSPDHFHQGVSHISAPPETEHGFTIHRDYAASIWPSTPIEGIMIQNEATEDEVNALVDELATEDALFIFSIDFSHYQPGDVAHVHDLRSMDILAARSVDEARSIEADCPTALELMLKLLERRDETLHILRNTNPAWDSGLETADNTTHIFARSAFGTPPARAVFTSMFFAHPHDWYLGKSDEDRYLYGYDEVFWDQGGTDHAVVQTTSQADETFNFE